jgi:uncharacterized protein YjbI with pentapeptide repeats
VNREPGREEPSQVQLLRDQVSKHISRNLELQRRLEELEREKAEVAIEAVTAALVQAAHSGEAAMAVEAFGSRRYAISQLQATLRGSITLQDDSAVLRLPLSEQPIPIEQMGAIHLTVSQVPSGIPQDAALALAEALEGAQASFNAWDQEPGVAAARGVATQATRLLVIRQRWGQEEFVQAVRAFAAEVVNFAEALTYEGFPESMEAFEASANRLLNLTQALVQARLVTTADIGRLATIVAQVTQRYEAIVQALQDSEADHKRYLLQFLYEAQLISRGAPIVPLSGADLRNANLKYATLEGAALDGAILENANLRGAKLSGADLGGAYLSGADLRDADLGDASLREADLQRKLELDLEGACLAGAELINTDLTGANLRSARGLTQEQVEQALGDRTTTQLPDDIEPPEGWSESASI